MANAIPGHALAFGVGDGGPANIAAGPGMPDVKFSPSTQLILGVIDDQNWYQLAWRTGIVADKANIKRALPLPLILRVNRAKIGLKPADFVSLATSLDLFGFGIRATWFVELFKNPMLDRIPAQLLVDGVDPSLMADDGEKVRSRLDKVLASGFVLEVVLASQHLPLLEKSMGDIGMPINRTYKGKSLSGKGVVVGIIDDGCAFAHQDFLVNTGNSAAPVYQARTAALWDQTGVLNPTNSGRGWKAARFYSYGREILAADIEKAINAPVAPVKPHVTPQGWVEEDAVYDYLDYPLGSVGTLASHGARVMGIAAGNGRSTMGFPGVAPEADVVFVQLPQTLFDFNPAALTTYILDAIGYVFSHAAASGQAAVVNLSLGGNMGPHDGTSAWEAIMDALLTVPGRCIVVSAGNAFESDTHVSGTIPATASTTHDWLVKAEDPTPNDVEIWYDGSMNVEVSLTAPNGIVYGPYKLGAVESIPAVGPSFGRVAHVPSSNGDCSALIWLWQSGDPIPELPPPPPGTISAAPGKWRIKIDNKGGAAIRYNAWIQRDDFLPLGARRQQSRFDPAQADPRSSLCDLATGRLTICVGAHNVATQEVAGYSSAGPTRPTGLGAGRAKPDVLAPAEEEPNDRGVLSTSSARGRPTRINGTSASAPHVAGMAALIFEYANSKGVSLTAAQILTALRASASGAGLVPDRHQIAAPFPVVKQAAIWNDVIGQGKANLLGALTFLFP